MPMCEHAPASVYCGALLGQRRVSWVLGQGHGSCYKVVCKVVDTRHMPQPLACAMSHACAYNTVSVYGGALRRRCTSSHSECGLSRYLAGAAADDEGAKRPSRMRLGGKQRQRRQQVDVTGVGVVLEPVRETAPPTAMCRAAASCSPAEQPWAALGVWRPSCVWAVATLATRRRACPDRCTCSECRCGSRRAACSQRS